MQFVQQQLKYALLIMLVMGGFKGMGQFGYGPAVYHQSFGVGSGNPNTIGAPLPRGRTSFLYDTSICPGPGSYTIERRVPVASCFDNEWIGLTHDADPLEDYGMMMIVNNITTDTHRVVYVDTVSTALCAGETYQFSAAFINLDLINGPLKCPGGLPDYPYFILTVEDDRGNKISENSGRAESYAAPPARGYEFTGIQCVFVTPPGINRVVLKITLQASIYVCAEDFAVDDILLRPRGPELGIKFAGEPSTRVKSFCFQQNSTASFNGSIISGAYMDPAFQWQQSVDDGINWTDIPGANQMEYVRSFSFPDTFLFRMTAGEREKIGNPYCRVASRSLRVEVDGLPDKYSITGNSPVCSGTAINFNAEGAARYEWSGPNGFHDNIPFPHITYSLLADSGWYYVNIYSLGGCLKKDSVHITMIGTDVQAGNDTAICKGDFVKLSASDGMKYEWSPPTGLSATDIQRPVAGPETTTVYTVKVTDDAGCVDTASVRVTLLNKQELAAAIEGTEWLCRSADSAFLKDVSKGNISYRLWNFGNGQTDTTKNPPVQHYTISPGVNYYAVKLAIADAAGCSDTAYQILKVVDNCYVAVPTAFTPNGDGLNDYLYPVNAYKPKNLVFTIFNRQGQLIFQSKNWQQKWDGTLKGTPMASGVYVWTLTYDEVSGKKIYLKGTTVLIR